MSILEGECETALKLLQSGLDESRERATERRLRILGKNGDGFGIHLRFENVISLLKDLTKITRVGDNPVIDDEEFGPTRNGL
jgi:hypothetical protein